MSFSLQNSIVDAMTLNQLVLELEFQTKTKRYYQTIEKGQLIKLIALQENDDILCQFHILLNGNNKFDHLGIKAHLIGLIDIPNDTSLNTEFLIVTKEIEPAGTLTNNYSNQVIFKFDKEFESFYGKLTQLRYFVKFTVQRSYNQKYEILKSFAVIKPNTLLYKSPACPIKLEVGFEELIHLEIDIYNSAVHLEGTIAGRVYFVLVNIPIKFMNLSIIKQETIYTSYPPQREDEKICEYEIMDGTLDSGDSVPFRLNLKQILTLSPTMNYIGGKFSVKYMISVQIVDDNNQKFRKNQEIEFYRAK